MRFLLFCSFCLFFLCSVFAEKYDEHFQRINEAFNKDGFKIEESKKFRDGIGYMAFHQKAVDRRYEGAVTLDPISGTYKHVRVWDFASLYPTMILRHNISFETVNCGHEACKSNIIEGTENKYACVLKRGIIPQLVQIIYDDRMLVKEWGDKDQNTIKTRTWFSKPFANN